MIDFDFVLEKVGTFGLYQIVVYFTLLYRGFPHGLSSLAPVFLSYTPNYRCRIDLFGKATTYPNETSENPLNISTPVDNSGKPIDPCVTYSYNATKCLQNSDFSCFNQSAPLETCYERVYDDSLFSETVVTEFDLVCERNVLRSVGSSMYILGYSIGSILFGNISDRFGRKKTSIVCTIGMLLVMVAVALSPSMEFFIGTRFFQGIMVIGMNIPIFTHGMEIVGHKWRTFAGMAYQVSFAMGYMLWSAIAYLYRDWHQMQWAMIVISLPLLAIVLIIPESARWLFATGKENEGKRVTRVMARFNKVELNEEFWKEAESVTPKTPAKEDVESDYTTIDLFRSRTIRILSLKIAFNWFVNSMVYYGVSLNAGSFAGNIFLNNIYAGILEILSYVVCTLIMDRVGRRLLLSITLSGAGLSLIASTVVNEYAGTSTGLIALGVVFAFAGRALVSGSYAIIYNFTAELYPTVVRSNAVGFGSTCARAGSVLSPFIIDIQDYVRWLPNAVFGSFALVGGLLSLTFRDTTGQPMMATMEEAKRFHSGQEIRIKNINDAQELLREEKV